MLTVYILETTRKYKMLKLINDYYVLHLLCYDVFKEDICHLKLTDKTKIVIAEFCIMQLGSKLQTKKMKTQYFLSKLCVFSLSVGWLVT